MIAEEVLGKIAAKPPKEKKPPKVKKPKVKATQNGEPASNGKPLSRKMLQDAKKDKRREHKNQLKETLASALETEVNKAGELIKSANSHFTMSQMSRAAEALQETSEGKFTEAEFIAKVEEYHEGDKQVEDAAVQKKAERKAANELKGAKANKKAKMRAEKELKKQELIANSASGRNGEAMGGQNQGAQQNQQMDEAAAPRNDGFSVEFWSNLAGSKAAAAVAATS